MKTRRQFAQEILGATGVALAAPLLDSAGYAQTRGGPARVTINSRRVRAKMDPRVMGSFLEHLGRAIYGGVYDPDSPLSDENGFRKDVMEEIRGLGVPIIRYPGGNFVSGYDWLDGVGPKDERPVKLDRAWNTLEPNQFGTNEFLHWCRLVNTEPMMAVNLGTGTPETAAALVEYCNVRKGTHWSDLRREHGVESPYNITYWCLGNEMDGWWQIGHMPAREYGRKARDAGRQIRTVSPSTKLVACGSSNPNMPQYLVWDRETLEECYHEVDGLSLHRYYNNTSETGGDTTKYVAMNLDMDRQIKETAAVCDYVGGLLNSPKKLWLSFDEWNVWYRARGGNGQKKVAPDILDEEYNLEDALLVGGLANTLIRNSDRVHVGCLAQIINVIAPLVTNEEDVLRQTIYYPYAWALEHAKGEVLDLLVKSDTYEVPWAYDAPYTDRNITRKEQVPYVDVTATLDPESGDCTLLMLNRDLESEREITFDWRDLEPKGVVAARTLTGDDLKAINTFEEPNRVAPQQLDVPSPGAKMTVKLPARSYSVLRLSMA